ncbi:hypothetical protein bcgnr5378_29840 [Bacillus cereus]|uniref:Uncharacterized protein n=1 Tax=Bacillus cereus TaxID=1396 RepID=A0A162PII6_BACCE|nr:hypothetical protein [Bacillus cereus]KZD72129.1 hypothetical protein B4088_0590 [Bacillus cereus]
MVNFANLIRANVERSNKNVRETERENEKLQNLLSQDDINPEPQTHSTRRIDLDSIMIGDDDSLPKPASTRNTKIAAQQMEQTLSTEIGGDIDDKDYFQEINNFDFLSLENIPLKSQNRILRTEYLEVRSRLKEFNEEMKHLTRKQRSLLIDLEKSQKETVAMRSVIKTIANVFPDGSELKTRLDTNDWVIEDVEEDLLKNLNNITQRVRNAEQYVADQLQGMNDEIDKYKKAFNIMHNEKQAIQQEASNSLLTIDELKQTLESLTNKIQILESENSELKYQLQNQQPIITEPEISEEERLRLEKLRLLQEKQKELELIQQQLAELNPLQEDATVSVTPSNPVQNNKPSNINITPTTPKQMQEEVHTTNNEPETTEEPADPFPAAERYDNMKPNNDDINSQSRPQPKLDKPATTPTQELHHEFKKEKPVKKKEIIPEKIPDIQEESFDIDAFLTDKLQLQSKQTESTNNEINKDTTTHTPTSSNTVTETSTPTIEEEIIIPINIEDHIQTLNDKKIYVLKSIGFHGYSRNQELSDFIQKDSEGNELFGDKSKTIKQEITNITRGLIDSNYLTAQRITMGGRGGYNFNSFELTDMGKAVFKHLTKQQPVISEMAQLKRQHGSYEHGYLIKEASEEFEAMGYKVLTDRVNCRRDLNDGRHKIFDFVIEKDGKEMLIEVERGTHNEEDFFNAMDKIYEITKDFYFITPNQTILYDKTRKQFHMWIKKRMGGSSDPRIKGVVTVNFLSFDLLKKTPRPKTLWKATKF